MPFITMLSTIQLLVTFSFIALLDLATSQSFVSTPANPTYAVKGSDVLLNWKYASTVAPGSKRWYIPNAAGSPKIIIMTQFGLKSPFKGNTDFSGRVSYVSNAGMRVRNVSLNDEGTLKFDVTFEDNNALDNTIQLIVTIPPKIVTSLASQTIVNERSESRLQCQFDARPAPTIKWYLNNIEVSNSRYSINTTTMGSFNDSTRVLTVLTINSSMPEDTGVISCVASLPNANMTSQTNHIVLYEPRDTKFTSDHANDVGSLGRSATFTCTAHGNPSIFFQMFKDSMLIKNSTVGVYVLNSTSLSDEGFYTCSPMNAIGVGPIKGFNFTVHVAPVLRDYTGSLVKSVLGSQVRISCTFYGEPAPNITWQRHSGLMSNVSSINTTVLSRNASFSVVKSSLLLSKVSKSDHGIYECMAKNMAGFSAQNISLDVQYAPHFNKSLSQNYTLEEGFGKNESWVCKATGNPEISFNWLVNGAPANSGFHIVTKKMNTFPNAIEVESIITMVGIHRDKAGKLMCNASNLIGSQQSTSNVFIHYIPSATRHLQGRTNVTLNDSVTLVCDVNSLPRPKIHWEKDGRILNQSDYKITQIITGASELKANVQNNLTITNAKKTDFGFFTCVAMNTIGNLTQQTSLDVLFKVEFLTSLAPVSYVVDGLSNYTLECTVIGNPDSTISWYKNETVIHATNNTQIINTVNRTSSSSQIKSILQFNIISKSDYGNYSCNASNALGSIVSSNVLVIKYKPFILQSSSKKIVTNASNTLTLFCEAQSSPAASIYWKVDNQKGSNFDYRNITYVTMTSIQHTTTRAELTIVNSTMVDNGMYSCMASNNLGTTFQNTTVVVQYAPMNLTSLSTEYREVEGSQFILKCAFLSNPTATISWKYNGSLITNTSSTISKTTFVYEKQIDRAITNSSILIKSLGREMRGVYDCKAENHQGLLSLLTKLIVDFKPTFLSSSTSKIVLNSLNSTFLSCKVESSPVSTITWLKDGVVIQNNTKMRISNSLQFKDDFKAIVMSTIWLNVVDKIDTGNYSCMAVNKLATKYQGTRIVVRYSPEISANFGLQQNLTESMTSLNFTCTVESHPAANIQWFKDGLPYKASITNVTKVSSDSKTILQSSIKFSNGIKRTNFGIYSCNASNLLGNAGFTTDVKIWYAPEFLSNMTGHVNVTKSGNISFECTVEANPAPTVAWYKDGRKINVISTQTIHSSVNKVILKSALFIGGTVKSDTALYKCQAQNVVASRHQSVSLNVQYRPQLLVASSNITANKSNQLEFQCNVNANPSVLYYIWTKDGKIMNHNAATYKILSAQNSSSGTYKCTPTNVIGSGKTVTFGLLVRIPPIIVSEAECKANSAKNLMICSCSGKGVPPPHVYWTKDSNMTSVASGNSFQKSLLSKNIDGKYHCRLKNILGEEVSTSSFYYYITPTTGWQSWSKCNVTCGNGFQIRTRLCNIASCSQHLSESKNCTVSCALPPTVASKDKPWAIALYVLIPVVVVLLAVVVFWIARTQRRKPTGDAVVIPVNGNLSKPPSVRNVPTRRDIYLPEKSFGSTNPAYYVEEDELQNSFNSTGDKNNTDIQEMEIKLGEDSLNESSTDKEDENNQAESGQTEPLSPGASVTDNSKRKSSENGSPVEVDTYLGPDRQTVGYQFYNEVSTAL